MKRLRIDFGNEWPYEWHKYYQCVTIFQIYIYSDGASNGIEFHLFNFWMRIKLLHKSELFTNKTDEVMKARYSKSEHCLQEVGEIEAFKDAQGTIYKPCNGRKLQCSDNFKGEDGKIYEEGKDYVLDKGEREHLVVARPIRPYTIPIQSESEDELQPSEIDKYFTERGKRQMDEFGWTGSFSVTGKDILDFIFTISRK